ncbi:uncharacterized protein LOC141855203 [Brevipalpus obovatus]|uniref:uncharacterized protein LOC141855203 n=1 Tax=Brevipalpus obovatus TaxID=246614 RepID=UPI003D9F5C51
MLKSIHFGSTFLIIFSISLVQTIKIPYYDCDHVNLSNAIKSIVVLNCVEQPCLLKPKRDIDFEIQMQLNHTVPRFFVELDAAYYDKMGSKVRVDTLTVQPPNCSKTKCKIRAGDIRCIHPSLRTKENISSLYDMKAILYDHKHNKIACAAFTLRITSM